MTTPLSISSQASDAEIDALVAQHCGWKPDTRFGVPTTLDGTPFPGWDTPPRFTQDLNALLPLISAEPYQSVHVGGDRRPNWNVILITRTATVHSADAPTLARALCLALLASRGFTILP